MLNVEAFIVLIDRLTLGFLLFVKKDKIFSLETLFLWVMKGLVFIIVLFFCQVSLAHEYFFSFAEMEYNAQTKQFELSIQASTHDVELVLKKLNLPVKELELQTRDSIVKKGLESWLNSGFQIQSGENSIPFKLIGFEILPNGLLYAYLESEPQELISPLHVKYDLLMADFPEQQNKITFTAYHKKQTAVFLPAKPEDQIIITP